MPLQPDESAVLPLSALDLAAVRALLAAHGLLLAMVEAGAAIPGSYWGEREAGLIGNILYARADTPVHSLLHEASHYICMDDARRATLHTNAGGADVEEHAVCFLECLLADELRGYSRTRCYADMDAWGYHFILGSAQAWFERDADDARAWLQAKGLLDEQDRLKNPPSAPEFLCD